MGLYHRRRPAPIKIIRRADAPKQTGAASPKSPESPGSAKSSASSVSSASSASSAGSASPGSASPTKSTFPASQAAATQTGAPAITSNAAPAATSISQSAPPPASTLATSTSGATPAASASSAAPAAASTTPAASSAPPTTKAAESPKSPKSPKSPESPKSPKSPKSSSSSDPAAPSATSSQGTTAPAAQITGSSSAANDQSSSVTSALADTSPKSSATSTVISTAPLPSNTASFLPENAGSTNSGQPQPSQVQKSGMSKGAEAALITLSILGFLAAVIGIFILFKRRRRRHNELGMRHAEDAFNPNNNGSLHNPETKHMSFHPSADPNAHMTKSSTQTASLFGASPYERPETVSTQDPRSRIQPPQPTPNPFADPGRNKAFDQIRGRPRSTTLTDRGSWVANPFKDPGSERFDPFGELKAKAREERVRYVENIRREQDEQRREKEAMGLGLDVPREVPRKGSGVTVEGVGVLDRTGAGGYR
ncbi:hypothetical protein P280DRAFT_193077 [Massarina eburnea CBS 473.64]|uniref:Uncharacterized protein n=1 Tax=Massarina eburnea CBS 473.64 TaxID=1395130 RepID=A0A6A6RJW5_9PLEO|nr:hypothetical protein P280DRAFT_193077 [Massarina eburnea CBS 473.64]